MNLLDDITKIRALVRLEARKYVLGLTSLFIINLSDVIAPLFLAMGIELTESSLTGDVPNTPTPLALAGVESAAFTMVGAIAVYLVLQFIAAIFRYPMLMYIAAPSHQIGQTVRRRLAGHLLKQSQSWYDRRKSGDLMSIGTADVMARRMFV